MRVHKLADFRLHVDLRKLVGNGLSNCWRKLLLQVTSGLLTLEDYHEYKSAWLPTIAREMLRLTRELTNPQDPFTVAVIKYSCVVEHVPKTISQTVSFLLGGMGASCFCEVTGAMVNHTTGFGLEFHAFTSFMATMPT